MRRHAAQHIEFPHEIFHELAGQLHRVPFHAVDAAHAQFVHACEQVVQAVPHFVEQRDDFVVRQARFFTGHGWREIAHQIGRRRLHLACLVARQEKAAAAVIVHPCAAAFAFARIQIHIHRADGFAVFFQLEIAHVFMPHGHFFLRKAHAV